MYPLLNDADTSTGNMVSPHQRIGDIMVEIELTGQAGVERTKKIRLPSDVTVLSSDDLIRVFKEFSTVE